MGLRLTIKPWNRVAINGLVVEALSRGVTIHIPDPSAEIVELGETPDRLKRAGDYVPWNLGKKYSKEHRLKIAEGMRRHWESQPEGWQRRRGVLRLLTDREAADFSFLRHQHHYAEAEALVAVGRGDLVEVTADKRDS